MEIYRVCIPDTATVWLYDVGPCEHCGHPIGLHISVAAPTRGPNGDVLTFLGWGPPNGASELPK